MAELFDVPLEERVITREDSRQVDYTMRILPAQRRVRAFHDGVAVADSTRASLVLRAKAMPVYYFPMADVRADLLTDTGTTKDGCAYFALRGGARTAWTHEDHPGLIAFFDEQADAVHVDGERLVRPKTAWSLESSPS